MFAAPVVAAVLAMMGPIVSMGAQAPATPPAAPAQGRGISVAQRYPVLPIGSPVPEFVLPGVDGKSHRLAEYSKAKVLAVLFESNHCPVSQLYEDRTEKIYNDYRNKGVQLVAINPNTPGAVRLDELGYTDVTDSMPEMKIRAAFRGIAWPYLYDGDTQAVSMKFGAVATPHIFIFDQERKLRYQGRIDDNQREELVKVQDARVAIDALLAGKPVPVTETRAFGCTTKWMSVATGVEQEWARIQKEPVTVDMVGVNELKALRANGTDKVTVVSFWNTGSQASLDQFFAFETTFRMFRRRAFNLVTVSTDAPEKSAAVLDVLRKQYASSPNKQFATADRAALQAAWGSKWNANNPFTVVLAPDGTVLYQKEGKIDILEIRRIVLANMPDTASYIGQKAYWVKAVASMKK
jgi:peroxiredoxin